MTAHSKIGASSMKRWAACPGSVRLSRDIESRSSAFAEEGTLAHAVGEAILCDQEVTPDANFFYTDHGVEKTATVTQEMLSHVETYEDAVRSRWDGVEGHMLVEQRFHLADLHAGLFGTSDAIVWQPGLRRLSVIDLKYGAGVPVEVTDNPQLLYYGLGALLANPQWKPVEVEVVIAQPRCPHSDGPVRSQVLPVVDLIDFAGELVAAVKMTEEAARWHGQVAIEAWTTEYLKAGDHCRWCPAAATCPKLTAKAQEQAKLVFAPGVAYDHGQLAETLEWLPILAAWIKNVREFAYAEAEKGHDIPRHKLVEKRATRKWRNEADAMAGLSAFLDDAELFEKKLITPAAAEKLLPKADREALDLLCVKESSGHTLVHESDKRDAVKIDAKSAFAGK
jgi:hypothetical protein